MTFAGGSNARPAPEGDEILIGRGPELARLDALLAAAVEGRGGVVFLTGEAGIGKSALAREFLRGARAHPNLSLVRGRCVDQYGAGEAYLPFLDALGRLLAGPGRVQTLAAMRNRAPTWCLQVPAAAETLEDLESFQKQTVGATKERMLRELVDGVGAAAAANPLVLLLEDLQWSDTSSIDALRFLATHVPRERVLLIGTLRPHDVEATDHPLRSCRLDLVTQGYAQEIALGPLGRDDVDRYLDARFPGHRFPPGLGAFIHARTEGQPLYVVSFVDLLRTRGDITLQDGAWALLRELSEQDSDVPETLRGMIRHRVELLPEAEREALQSASVIGRDFLSTVLAAVLEADELVVEERLQRLERVHHLIEARGEEELPDGSVATRYSFAHWLHQQVVYGDLGSKRRTTLHERTGHALGRHYGAHVADVSAALALHLERGRDFAGAISALVQAGERAVAFAAHGEALDHFGQALRLVERLPLRLQDARRAILHQRRGLVLQAMGRFDESASEHARAVAAARALDDVLVECGALFDLCDALFFAQRVEEMAVRAHEALGAAARSGAPHCYAHAVMNVARVTLSEGRLAESIALFDEVVTRARGLGHEPSLLGGLAYRGFAQYWQGDYARAEEAFREGVCLAEEQGDGFLLLGCRMQVGMALANRGLLSEAQAVIAAAIEQGIRNADRVWLPRLVSHLGWIRRELGDAAGARSYDEESLRLATEHSVPMAPETDALLNLCLDHARAGREDEASRIVARLEGMRGSANGAWFGWLHELRLEGALGERFLVQGDLERARAHTDRLHGIATRLGARSYLSTALRLRARIALLGGDLEAARVEAEAACAQQAGFELPLEAWKAFATLGLVCRMAGALEDSRGAYRRSGEVVRELAGHVADESLRAEFLGSPAVREVMEGAAAGEAPGA